MEKYGWWKVNFKITIDGKDYSFSELDECSKEHILEMIKHGCWCGEVCMISDDEYEDDGD